MKQLFHHCIQCISHQPQWDHREYFLDAINKQLNGQLANRIRGFVMSSKTPVKNLAGVYATDGGI
jgi:hypothetical protein